MEDVDLDLDVEEEGEEDRDTRTGETTPTPAQLRFFAENDLVAHPTRLACAATIRYFMTGFPGNGDLSLEIRMEQYREACVRWVGRQVCFTRRGERSIGTILYIQGMQAGEYSKKVGDRSPFIAVIQCSSSRGEFSCSLSRLSIY